MWKMIKGDNIGLSGILIVIGLVTAFVTILIRLGACSSVPVRGPQYTDKLEIDVISYVKFERCMVQVRTMQPYLPEYSENWTDKYLVIVNWRIGTRMGRSFSGSATAVLKPPFDSFIFSLEKDLTEELEKIHSEWVFLNEERRRIIREINEMYVEIVHPETENVEATFTQKYDPEQRGTPAIRVN